MMSLVLTLLSLVGLENRKKEKMNPKILHNESRQVVWTISANNPELYCLYIGGYLYSENLSFNDFYPMYNRAISTHKGG